MNWKPANVNQGSITPNMFISEGLRPAQKFLPAAYLRLVRYDKKVDEYKVISTGKAVSVDWNNYLVPAGLAYDIKYALDNKATLNSKADFITAANAGRFAEVYDSSDVAEGVKNSQGEAVTVGEPVVASFFTDYDATKVQLNGVGKVIGLAPQDIWRSAYATEGYSGTPMDTRYANFELQTGSTVLTRYFIELPVVSDHTALILPGMTVFEGSAPKPGSLVTFNSRSNLVELSALEASAFAAGTAGDPTDAELKAEFNRIIEFVNSNEKAVLGKVLYVDTQFPKDFLEMVRTYKPNGVNISMLQTPDGSATKGLPNLLTFAGQVDPSSAKTVKINILI